MLCFCFDYDMFSPFFMWVPEFSEGHYFVHEVYIEVDPEYLFDRVCVDSVEFELSHGYIEEVRLDRVDMGGFA